jgi:hypothetical protein
MIKRENKYRIPAGTEVKPSALGYYNFWYPDEKKVFFARESLNIQPLNWGGSDTWSAVYVNPDTANNYESPIKVLWVRKNLLKDIIRAPAVREVLKKRWAENER